jgi:choline-sulfatase
MTGKYVHQISTWMIGVPIDRREMTWARRLTELGYATHSYGKMDFCGEYQNPGFKEFVTYLERPGFDPYPRSAPIHQRLRGYSRPGKRRLVEESHLFEEGARALSEEHGEGYLSEFHYQDQRLLGFGPHDRQVTNRGLQFLRESAKREDSRPFALYLGYLQPHWPFVASRKLFERYYPDNILWPHEADFPNEKLHPALREFQQVMCLDGLSNEDVKRTVALYYAMVTDMDSMVGEVISELKRLGFYENTYIVYTSDHGESLGEHGLFYKECSYDCSVGVPLILKGPGVPAGREVSQPVSLVDLYPTLMELAGTDTESDRAGHSLLPLAKGQSRGYPDQIFAEFHANMIRPSWYMVRNKEFKYTYYTNSFPPTLFNMVEDPKELNDLASDSSYASLLKEFRASLDLICDPEATAYRSKEDLGLIGPTGEDYTETLSVQELLQRT